MAINLKKTAKKVTEKQINEINARLVTKKAKEKTVEVEKLTQEVYELRKSFSNLSDEFLIFKSNVKSYLDMMRYSMTRTLSETKELTPEDISYNVNMVNRLVERDYNKVVDDKIIKTDNTL